MLVREVMTRNVEVVHPDDTLQEAAEKMKELDIGPLPVCDDGKLVGILTDRDIAVRAVAEGQDPWTDKVRDVMTPEVVSCCADQDVADAVRLMKEKQIRRLVVLDNEKRLVGILSLGDVALHTSEQLAGATLEEVSKPS